ncbi:MAG: hypothetical protein HYT68_01865 [Candidatus Zambryskibacteria bacterium]|nr:hypothetical protein [Candidatus Zambryskibacteria bacterium]
MTPVITFIISGIAIVVLVGAKKMEEKRNKPLFVFNIISKGDKHVRELYHKMVNMYSEGKEKILFFFKKQVPIQSKNLLNKSVSFLKEKRAQYINNMRGSKLLKKSDGISEFFKNMSNIEKGNGEINDVYEDGSQDK